MRIVAEGMTHTLEGVVSDDADLDGEFVLTTDDGEELIVYGWNFVTEIVLP